MKHAHAAEATLPPPPSPLTELQPPVQLVDTRDEKTLLVHDLLLDFDELRGLLGKELYGRRWLDAFLLAAGMDQILLDPPTVGGWPQNASWISSSAMLARANFAQAVVNRGGSLPDATEAVRTQLDNTVSADTAAVFNASQTNTDRWYAILSSPEFHLK